MKTSIKFALREIYPKWHHRNKIRLRKWTVFRTSHPKIGIVDNQLDGRRVLLVRMPAICEVCPLEANIHSAVKDIY